MKTAMPGMQALYVTIPGPGSTAEAIGNDGIRVVSTPHIIGLLEEASHRAVRDLYEVNEATVGTKVDIEHLAPAFPGEALECRATLTAIEGRRLRFTLLATQAGRDIMHGSHERALVKMDRFQPVSAGARAVAEKSPIEFFFDYHSPWCYLAAERLESIAARCRRRISWRPLHLANLIERIDGRRPLEANPAFVRWFKQDMQDWAAIQGLPLRYHPNFPLRPSRALRASAYAVEQGKAAEFVRATMRAYWAESRDISDLTVLAELGKAAGLDPDAVVAASSQEAYKLAVEANGDDAVARGVFGAPTFFAEGRMFWGNDRLEMMEHYLIDASAA